MSFPASRLLAALILAFAAASCARRASSEQAPLEPWQVVDPAFQGCEGG
jgi:hypothetical protein